MADIAQSGSPILDAVITTADPRVQHALEHIDRNLDRTVHMAELAEVAGVERRHFSRLFQRCTGWRCSAWIRSRRVVRARVLLLDGRSSVSDVAAELGCDVRTLQRVFRAYCGSTPKEYRDAARVADGPRLIFPLTDLDASSREKTPRARKEPRDEAGRRRA